MQWQPATGWYLPKGVHSPRPGSLSESVDAFTLSRSRPDVMPLNDSVDAFAFAEVNPVLSQASPALA